MDSTIAVAHYPEGAGHATRMLAVADAIEAAGGEVRIAGGGAGSEFVELNGYDAFEPTTVDYIDTYQGGSLWQAARQSLPASLARIADYRAWLSATDPDALVTDDMFAAMAATRCDVPLYVLKHDMPGLYDDPVERAGAGFHSLFQLSAARKFFYPVVWPASSADPNRATRIPPVALDGQPSIREDADVVVVPSHYSSLSRISSHLRRQGHDVIDVADDDWEPVPSLLPYIRGADVVVCSGYSTIMDAAVAGTPCIVLPETDEQAAVAAWLERFDVTGFTVAEDPIDVLDAVVDPPASPNFDNGATFIAESVLTDLRDPDPYAEPTPGDDEGDVVATAGVRSLVAIPTLVAACAATAATATVVAPVRLSHSLSASTQRFATWIAGVTRRARRGARSAASRVATATRSSVNSGAAMLSTATGDISRTLTAGCQSLRSATRRLSHSCRRVMTIPSIR